MGRSAYYHVGKLTMETNVYNSRTSCKMNISHWKYNDSVFQLIAIQIILSNTMSKLDYESVILIHPVDYNSFNLSHMRILKLNSASIWQLQFYININIVMNGNIRDSLYRTLWCQKCLLKIINWFQLSIKQSLFVVISLPHKLQHSLSCPDVMFNIQWTFILTRISIGNCMKIS